MNTFLHNQNHYKNQIPYLCLLRPSPAGIDERMKKSPLDIMNDPTYLQVEILAYEEVIPFVFKNIKKFNTSTVVFYISNAIFLFFLIVHFLSSPFEGGFSLWHFLFSGFLGFIVFPLLLAPIHEILHAAAYKILGATRIKIGVSLSQYLFYVTADKFVAGFHEMIFVALTPFVLISTMLIYLFLTLDSNISTALLMSLFAHGTMCIGDFAILSFFYENGGSRMVTFDLFDKKEAYFYTRN